MTLNRDSQICLEATPYYHCYVRCVRRAYLCGEDRLTGANYDHRKQWIVSRLRFLSYVYAIDICAYAVMSNHYHVVLHVDEARAQAWTAREVAERWMQLYKGHRLVDRWLAEPGAMDKASQAVMDEIIADWRQRLCSISWFMRGVNERIARMANDEDGSKGRFWESRFKSQALLDEAALLTCMVYVDLNPVRASMADDLADSDFTAIQQRLFDVARESTQPDRSDKTQSPAPIHTQLAAREQAQQALKTDLQLDDLPQSPLMPFDGSSHTDIHTALPFSFADYLELADQTGRLIRDDKRGFIADAVPSLVGRLGIDPDQWLAQIQQFGRRYANCVGSADNICNYADYFGRAWCKGVRNARRLYVLPSAKASTASY